jgi:hypothetical protein
MTAKYPVENSDEEGIVDAVNYLLSGPAGLGQNFDGFSDYNPAYLAGTVRAPFTVPITTTPPPTLYVAPIAITNITVPNNPGAIFKVFYTEPDAPFLTGDSVRVRSVTDTSPPGEAFNGRYSRSVVESTASYTLIQWSAATNATVWSNYVSGGTIEKNLSNTELSTDCNGRVTVYGPTDRVFLSAQLNLDFTYDCTVASEWDIQIKINRYYGEPTDTPGDNDYLFDLDTNPVVSEQVTHYSESTSGSSGNVEYIFTTVLDQPSFGYYWYILDIVFSTKNPALGGLLESNMGTTDSMTYAGTKATLGSSTTYTGVTPTTLTGIGSGAVMDVTLLAGAATAYSEANTRIFFDSGTTDFGADYAVGDTLLIVGTDIGGASPANDMTVTVVSINPQDYPGDATPGVFTLGLRSFTAQVIKQ